MKKALLVFISWGSQELEGCAEQDLGKCAHTTACLWLGITRAEREEECRLGFWHLIEIKLRSEKWL